MRGRGRALTKRRGCPIGGEGLLMSEVPYEGMLTTSNICLALPTTYREFNVENKIVTLTKAKYCFGVQELLPPVYDQIARTV